MGTIQTNIGLISGMQIGDTVDQLMKLAAKPRDTIQDRTDTLQKEQAAVTELSALLLAVKFTTDRLGQDAIYDQRKVTSSDEDLLTASISGNPPKGTYQFTPLRTVQNQQMLSEGLRTRDEPLAAGKITFRFGDHVERPTSLDQIDGGEGIARGKILITDRSGATAEIDLTTVTTIADVLDAINQNDGIQVTASADGDSIRLTDKTGKTASNLKVQEVGLGTTAASLGLGSIDVAASMADGADMIWLTEDIDLIELNDGRGIERNRILPDISYTLRDGTTGEIDLSPILDMSSSVEEEMTLGEILEVINATEPGKFKVEIAADGDRLVMTDMTVGAATFTLNALNDSRALADLGLTANAVDDTITGRRLLGGVSSVLLSSLNGGAGFGELGAIDLTDRAGGSATVDLSAAETLADVIDTINAAGIGITAQVNDAKNGIILVDTTGSTANHLVVANNGDGTTTADKLGIAVDAADTSVGSGDMHLQVVARSTMLESLNGGAGVARGKLTIRDSAGDTATLDISDADEFATVGDVIDEINRLGIQVHAEINTTGDGIRIIDTAGGTSTMTIEEGLATTAADLNLLVPAEWNDVDGQMSQVIDGSMTYTFELDGGGATVDRDTLLADYNGGDGVDNNTVVFTDTAGKMAALDLSDGAITTLGGVIDAINALDIGIRAEINPEDTGIRIIDTAEGEGDLRILEGNGTSATDLHLLEPVTEVTVDGKRTQVVDGAGSSGISSLDDLIEAINDRNLGVTAMAFVDGSNRPFRLTLASQRDGMAGSLVVDTSTAGFSMQESIAARDALLVFGDADNAVASIVVTSASNTFRNVIPDVTLTIRGASTTTVSIDIGHTDTNLIATVDSLVTNYNTFRERLDELTAYDADADSRSLLTGDASTRRLDSDLSNLLSGRFFGTGALQSFRSLGISLKSDGTLSFDKEELRERFEADPRGIERLLNTPEFGVADKFSSLIDQAVGDEDSLLSRRIDVLKRKIEQNEDRIEFMTERLAVQRNRMLISFYRMESAIAGLQENMAALDAIQPIAPLSAS